VTDIKHTVTAAASSSSASRAADFLKEVDAPTSAASYGSYAELVQDANVDIIYVATPHSHHYQNVMLCLNANKHVLCEKAFTTNAAQARALVSLAKSKGLFLMEAVWTRYFPLSIYVRELIGSGKLGNVTRVSADCSINSDPEKAFADGSHRMVNPALAGGPLLDLGVYSLNWVFQCLYLTQHAADRQKPNVVSAVKPYGPTGCDEMCSMLLTFPRKEGGDAHAIATTSLRAASSPGGNKDAPAVRVQGDKGEVQVFPMIFRPTRTKVVFADGTVEEKEWEQPGGGKFFFPSRKWVLVWFVNG
jgi:dihydrodiol dehydrogenase / D-xylose 1-dehydrogenase (NADP)